MPRDGRGIWSPPPGTRAVPNAIIESEKYNAFTDDVQADLNAARPVTAGGTGATNASDARANLGAASADDLRATNADLTASKDRFAGDIKSAQTELGKKFDKAGGRITGDTTFDSIARFQAGMTITGDLYATGRLVVGESPDGSWITMRDLDEGNRFIHNNGESIGFVGRDGGWVMRVYDNGDIWSRTSGWMSDRLNAKFDKTGGTVIGDLEIQKTQPCLTLLYPNVSWWRLQVASNGNLYLTHNVTGDNFVFGAGGDIWTKQFGDLNTRIETRAREYAEDRANRVTARLAFAGDLPFDRNHQDTPVENFSGAVITGHAAAGGYDLQLRYRYLQMKNAQDQWYTVPFI